MDSELRRRFAAARVARLGTVAPDGGPHLVPVVFVLEPDRDVVWTAVDSKPKSTRRLRRLANIETNARVSLLVDHYDDDWRRLWWVRADGHATISAGTDPETWSALDALAAKYPQYSDERPAGPVIRIEIDTWRTWAAAPNPIE
ncbi:MAG TPA: TIGR03668 family PPOX class F420-dependent oxidoreductase [Intrasporangium sp.]|uniref:TIGR03668 family PPOX class F420-dependent oxidoreductase n=1 Tax=Intrasporangium sp. TaxID=1925024 RepID=UPI002F9501F5